jgi:hypothetical protein
MRTLLTTLVLSLLIVSATQGVLANNVGGGVTPDIQTADMAPMIFGCDDRVVFDDGTEPGRLSGDGAELIERLNNYAFEGEQIQWTVLVFDKNGIEKVNDVYATIGSSQGEGNDIEVNCQRTTGPRTIPAACNARINEEVITEFNSDMMDYYQCTFSVETADSMYGEYWITAEAEDNDGLLGTMDENEYWFLNPVIALSIEGAMAFEDVLPGTSTYSDTLLVGNDADASSGVMMDMFISGTDFYDSSPSGAMCPDTNQLNLGAFRYFATHGAYSTSQDLEIDPVDGDRSCDAEGYCNIEYGNAFNNPSPFYDNAEILQAQHVGPYYMANALSPGSEMAVTFKLDLPEPCNGDFDTGSIFFWGEAI